MAEFTGFLPLKGLKGSACYQVVGVEAQKRIDESGRTLGRDLTAPSKLRSA